MAWYNSSWLKRKKITIQQSQVDADLTDYPVMVDLADANILASARADMRDVLFTSSDETTKLSHELVKRRFISQGGWSWFSNPRAVYHNGTSERTYIGSVDGQGNLYVTQYTHTTGAVVSTQLTAALAVDDHVNPAVVVRPSDSKLVALYAKHAADDVLRWKISTNAEDATAWGSESTSSFSGNVTYANPIILPDDSDACYVFTRVREAVNDYSWRYKRTTDFSTWGSEVEIWDGGATQSYLHCARNGDGRIDFFVSDMHPDNDTGGSSLYHFYAAWDTSTLKWYNSAGTEQTLPMTPSNATLVYDGSGGNDGWNHQIAIDGSSYPRVLFQKRVSTDGTGDMRCMFSRWNGSAWITPVEITALGGYVYSGEISYTGLSCFDGSDTNKVYLGKEVSGIYEIQEYTTSDSGATWTKSRDITSGSSTGTQNLRPFSPLGHTGRMACLWSAGTYTSYTSFNLSTYCDPPIATEAYVKVPTVSGSTDTEIYVYYGNASAADQESATGAWNSGYKAVFHLEQPPAKSVLTDSTSNAVTATKKSYSEPGAGSPTGQKFDGVDDYVTLGTAINMAGWTAATIEALVSYDGSGASGDEHQVFSNWGATNTVARLMLRMEPTAGSNALEGFAVREADTQVGGAFGLTVTPNQNEFVGLVYDSTSLRGYLNSSEGGTTYSTSGAAFDAGTSETAYLGFTPHTTSEGLTGTIYEIRISDVARSAAWMKATSINLKTPTTFYSVGAETTQGVQATAGTIVVSGMQATISEAVAATTVECSAGTIVVAGGTGALLSTTLIPATAATVALSGQTATIKQTTLIPASAGTIVLAGQQASITESGAVVCTAGTIVLAGQQASIWEAAATTVECSAGTIVLAGQQAGITESGVGTSIQCSAGTIVLSGQQASITESVKTEVECSAGLIVVSGEQATVTEVIPVPTTVECSAGLIVVSGTTCTIEAATGLKGRRPRRRYTTYIEPEAPEVPGTPPVNYGAAFGSLAPMLPAPAITPPLASTRPKLKLIKRKPAPLPAIEEPPPPPPRKPHLVVIEGRGHVVEAVPPLVVDRVAQALEHLAGAIRSDPRIARQVTEALVPLLTIPEEVDEEEEIIRMLLRQQGAA